MFSISCPSTWFSRSLTWSCKQVKPHRGHSRLGGAEAVAVRDNSDSCSSADVCVSRDTLDDVEVGRGTVEGDTGNGGGGGKTSPTLLAINCSSTSFPLNASTSDILCSSRVGSITTNSLSLFSLEAFEF